MSIYEMTEKKMRIKKILDLIYWFVVAVTAICALNGMSTLYVIIMAGVGLGGISILHKVFKIPMKIKESNIEDDEEIEYES